MCKSHYLVVHFQPSSHHILANPRTRLLSAGKSILRIFSPKRKQNAERRIRPMAAIDRLPVELFYDIFDKFLEDGHLSQPPDGAARPLLPNNFHSDPTVLGQVCFSWRELALGYQKLWRNIFILNPKVSQVYLTEQWLKRAGTAPLNLAIRISKDLTEDRDEEIVAASSMLLLSFFSRAEHWKEINWELPCDLMTQDMLSILQASKDCSRLESAKIMLVPHNANSIILGQVGNEVYREFWKFLSQSASLRRVSLTCPQKVIPRVILQLANTTQWDQLTQVGLCTQVYLQDLITLLNHAQLLERLIVYKFYGINHGRSSSPPPILSGTIDLNRLHTFKVNFECGRISTLLNYITCPSLRDLAIVSSNNQVLCDSDSFRSFLSRSGCQLHELSLVGFFGMGELDISEDHLVQYLTAASEVQSLKSLKLLVSSISTSILHLLASQADSGIHHICPNLERLTLSNPDTSTDALQLLLALRKAKKADGKTKTLGCPSGSLGLLETLSGDLWKPGTIHCQITTVPFFEGPISPSYPIQWPW